MTLWVILGCSYGTQNTTKLKYPYIAPLEKANYIKENYKKISIGQSISKVETILGKPDEISPLYEPIIKNGKIIGKSYWYFIQKLKENGSVNERQEKLVRITFNLNGKVISVDAWGFEND
jgi:hypothetical protein